jgi:hypothetical protein
MLARTADNASTVVDEGKFEGKRFEGRGYGK